jgi:hypothetical protein
MKGLVLSNSTPLACLPCIDISFIPSVPKEGVHTWWFYPQDFRSSIYIVGTSRVHAVPYFTYHTSRVPRYSNKTLIICRRITFFRCGIPPYRYESAYCQCCRHDGTKPLLPSLIVSTKVPAFSLGPDRTNLREELFSLPKQESIY